jgi:hypothetical protein
MQPLLKTVRILIILLLVGNGGWFALVLLATMMQTSSEKVAGMFKYAWPPFVFSAVVGLFLLAAAYYSELWRPMRKLGWWTLGISYGFYVFAAFLSGGLM